MSEKFFSAYSKEELSVLTYGKIKELANKEYDFLCENGGSIDKLKGLRAIIRSFNEENYNIARYIDKHVPDDISQSLKLLGLPDREKQDNEKTKWRFSLPKPPTQMSKWFNTTSGFVTGIFGGFLMVTVAGAFVSLVGLILFVGGAYGVMQVNLLRCNAEYGSEKGQLTDEAIQQCRVKVGLGRSDGSDKGYWQ